jgi:hypothetical protein
MRRKEILADRSRNFLCSQSGAETRSRFSRRRGAHQQGNSPLGRRGPRPTAIDWRFTPQQARAKLATLYPDSKIKPV